MITQYTAIVIITAFSMAVMMVAVKGDNFIALPRKHWYMILFALLIAVNIAEWLGAYLDGAASDTRALHIIAKFAELTLTPVIPVVSAMAIGGYNRMKWMYAPMGINFILQVTSLFTGIIFSVDAGNVYHRGPLYLLYVATFLCSIIFLFMHCYAFSRRYQYHNALFLSLIMLLVLFASFLQIIDHTLRLDWACISIASMLFYIYYNELVQQIDALTSLLNRHSYNISIERLNTPAAILFFDVDRFKNVNDNYGHQFGDICLTALAAEIKSVFGKYGHCYRFGGDEFCVIMIKQYADVERSISTFLRRMETLRADEPNMPRVSVGYALFDPSKENVNEALQRADSMMYEFKQKRHASEAQ